LADPLPVTRWNFSARVAPRPASRRILIIDDHVFFSSCLRTLLTRAIRGVECQVVAPEADLVARLGEYDPQLLVVDLSLGRADGYALAESIRAAGLRVPILFASTGSPVTRRSLARLGRASFIPKSASPTRLVGRIRSMLALTRVAAATGLPAPV
jgi:two-component system, OmpR family, response regulator MprA